MSLFQKFILAVRFIGFWPTVRTILYALYRDWHNWERSITSGAIMQSPGELQNAELNDYGGKFHFQHGITLEIKFLAPDIVRTTWTPGKLPVPYALTDNALEGSLSPITPQVNLATRKENGGWVLSSPALTLNIHSDGTLEYVTPTGMLRREHPPVLNVESWSQTAELHPTEHIYGLGERAAPLNLRGGTYRFWNTDPAGSYGPGADPLYVTIPVYISQHKGGSYLVFHENSWDGEIEFEKVPTEFLRVPKHSDKNGKLIGTEGILGNSRVSFTGGALRTYFIPGDLPHLTRRFSDLTGRTPLPPRWALGFHQSRWGYMNERDIREVVEGFRQRDLPLAAIHLDIDYMRGFRVFTVDESRFPNLSGLASDLEKGGVKLVTIIDPGVKRDKAFDVYQEGLAGGMFCSSTQIPRVPTSSEDRKERIGTMGTHRNSNSKPIRSLVWPGWCAHPDFTNPKAREWWGQYYARLLDQGVAGIWHDMNEPATMAAWGELTIPRRIFHDLDGHGGGHSEAHNVYGMMMNRAGFEALKNYFANPHPSTSVGKTPASAQDATTTQGKRPWILSRSGWAGNQCYAWHWTADTESSWAALKMTIAEVLNLGLSGYPFTGPDIGGFSGTPDAELFVRWFQMAAFMPFFRVHSAKGTPRREPWVYGEEVLEICREFMKLRERLLPYLYTLAWEASQTGAPLCRPLFWLEHLTPEFAERIPPSPSEGEGRNPELWAVDDVFLLGNDLLIAPVLEPGAKLKRIPLTPHRWYNFWRDDMLDDSDFVESRVTLDRIPILVRGGSILPMADGDKLALHVYPDRDGKARGVLYSDVGDGYGAWRVDRFRWEGGELAQEVEGEFEWPYQDLRIEVHGMD